MKDKEVLDASKAIEAHHKAYEKWPHGAAIKQWIDENGDMCIRYEDGVWFHYDIEYGDIVWW